MAPSAPGRLAIHSSALAAVIEYRGSMWITRAACPSRSACARRNAAAYPTGEIHVSRKSAPSDRIVRASSKA